MKKWLDEHLTLRLINLLLGLYLAWLASLLYCARGYGLERSPGLLWVDGAVIIATGLAALALALDRWVEPAYLVGMGYFSWVARQYPYSHEIHFEFVTWTLAFLLLLRLARRIPEGSFPREVASRVYWFVFGVAYGLSGLMKLRNPNYRDGRIVHWFLSWNEGSSPVTPLFTGETTTLVIAWLVGLFELLAIVAIPWRRARAVLWSAMTLMHFGIATMTRFTHISVGLLIYQLLGLYVLIRIDPPPGEAPHVPL